MKTTNILHNCAIFSRLLIITLSYFLLNRFINFDLVMEQKFFISYLILYFLIISLYIIFSRKKIFLILLILVELMFITVFLLEIGFYIYYMYRTPGEAGFGYLVIVPAIVMLSLFIIWIRKNLEMKRET